MERDTDPCQRTPSLNATHINTYCSDFLSRAFAYKSPAGSKFLHRSYSVTNGLQIRGHPIYSGSGRGIPIVVPLEEGFRLVKAASARVTGRLPCIGRAALIAPAGEASPCRAAASGRGSVFR
ncbi:hypothetical protein RHECNPAF_14110072 [Rhizobium etli CNPAF512]|nr:hypothetical protein RHECNPAF_14110072 [Rhizobium etli CNPAF512]